MMRFGDSAMYVLDGKTFQDAQEVLRAMNEVGYRYGAECSACGACHCGSRCEFEHEGGKGQKGGDLWLAYISLGGDPAAL